jgi:transcription elongation factor S-II
MTSPFQPGEQVWVHSADDSSLIGDDQWYPAKVVSPELEDIDLGLSDLLVRYYGRDELGLCTYSPDTVVPYEGSSSKAVTSNSKRRDAIEEANNDADILQVAHPELQAAAAAAPRKDKAEKKRRRTEAAAGDEVEPEEREAAMSDAEAIEARSVIEGALASCDASALRKALIRLAKTRTTLRQLVSTKIGVAVGKVLGYPEHSAQFPIVRCVLRYWANELPDVTKRAMVEVGRQVHLGDDAAVDTQRPSATATAAAAAAAAPAKTSTFNERLADAFTQDPPTPGGHSLAGLTDIVTAFANAANTREKRQLVLKTLSKPGHGDLRQRILGGGVGAAAFLEFTKTQLQTPAEIAEHQARLDEKLRELQESEASLLQVSTLYECPKCLEKKCKWYEQQTRGADEPLTVFINCLNCGNNWCSGNYD